MVHHDLAAAPARPFAGHTGERGVGVHQPGRPHARHRRPGRHHPARGTCAPSRPLGAPLPGLPNRQVAPQFTPDGAYLFAITDAGRAYRWDMRPSAWARHACAVAGRTLTRAEWHDALPGRDYAPACAG